MLTSSLKIPSWLMVLLLWAYLVSIWVSFLVGTGWNGLVYLIHMGPVYLITAIVVLIVMGCLWWKRKILVIGWMSLGVFMLIGVFTVLSTYRPCGDSNRCEAILPVFPNPQSSMEWVYVHGSLPIIAVLALLIVLWRTAKQD